MTDREKAIVMARTGICMLEGEKLDLFYQYLAELFGRPVYTHELPTLQSEIEKRSNADFIKICRDEQPHWIPCSERLPKEDGQYLITVKYKHVNDSYEDVYAEHGELYCGRWDMFCFGHCGEVEDIIAWMPLPEAYSEA